jgi:4-oxalocrotonate tautomerase
MPLVRIALPAATSAQDLQNVSDAVHQALVATFNVPLADRFQIISRKAPEELVCTSEFLGVQHTPSVVFVQISCSFGRTVAVKKALYAAIAEGIAASTSVKAADTIINLVETAKENWSFGKGLAQYAD